MKKLLIFLLLSIFLVSSVSAVTTDDPHIWEKEDGGFIMCPKGSNTYIEYNNGNNACTARYGDGVIKGNYYSEYKQISGCGLSEAKNARLWNCMFSSAYEEPDVTIDNPHVWEINDGNFVFCDGDSFVVKTDGNKACGARYGTNVIFSYVLKYIWDPENPQYNPSKNIGGGISLVEPVLWKCSFPDHIPERDSSFSVSGIGEESEEPEEPSFEHFVWETKEHGFIVCKEGNFDVSYDPDRLNFKTCGSFDTPYPDANLSCYPPGSADECMYNGRGCNYNDRPCVVDGDCNEGEACDRNSYICVESAEALRPLSGLGIPDVNPEGYCGDGIVQEELGERCDVLKYTPAGYNSFDSALDACKAKYSNYENVSVGFSSDFEIQDTGCGSYEARMWDCIVSGEVSCVEDWECSAWSDCVSGVQTRTCVDNNNCNTTLDKPADTRSCGGETTTTTGSGGGGGGGGSSSNRGRTTTGVSRGISLDVDIVNGISRYFDLGNQGTFEFKGVSHRVYLKEIKENSVIMVFESYPVEVELKLGESKNIDIDRDDVDDLEVKLVRIYDYRAEVKIKEIVEKKAEEKKEDKKEEGMEGVTGGVVKKIIEDYTVSSTLIILAALFVVLIIRLVRKSF